MANTLNVQTHLDARLFADIIRWMKAEGLEHRGNYSSVVRLLLTAVQKEQKAEFFQDTDSALTFLASEGFSIAQLKGDKKGKLFRELSAEAVQQAQREEEEREAPPVEEGKLDEVLALFQEED